MMRIVVCSRIVFVRRECGSRGSGGRSAGCPCLLCVATACSTDRASKRERTERGRQAGSGPGSSTGEQQTGPAIPFFVARASGRSADRVEGLLNTESGFDLEEMPRITGS
jgi:hypothetical protein